MGSKLVKLSSKPTGPTFNERRVGRGDELAGGGGWWEKRGRMWAGGGGRGGEGGEQLEVLAKRVVEASGMVGK